MKASIKNYHQAPRKVRLVANLVKGKKIDEALALLDFTIKRASLPLKKLILSAVANAVKNFNENRDELVIKDLTADQGLVMSRFIAGAHGRAYPLNRRTTNVKVTLEAKKK